MGQDELDRGGVVSGPPDFPVPKKAAAAEPPASQAESPRKAEVMERLAEHAKAQPPPRPVGPTAETPELATRAIIESERQRLLELVAAGFTLSTLDQKRLVETDLKLRLLEKAPAPEGSDVDTLDWATSAEMSLLASISRLHEVLEQRSKVEKLPPAPPPPAPGIEPIRPPLAPRRDCDVYRTVADLLLFVTELRLPHVVYRPTLPVTLKAVRLAHGIAQRNQLGPELPADLEGRIDRLLEVVSPR